MEATGFAMSNVIMDASGNLHLAFMSPGGQRGDLIYAMGVVPEPTSAMLWVVWLLTAGAGLRRRCH